MFVARDAQSLGEFHHPIRFKTASDSGSKAPGVPIGVLHHFKWSFLPREEPPAMVALEVPTSLELLDRTLDPDAAGS